MNKIIQVGMWKKYFLLIFILINLSVFIGPILRPSESISGNDLIPHLKISGPTNSISSNSMFNFSTYFGGNESDDSHSVAVDSNGNSFIVGTTNSPDFPIKNAYNATYGGGSDIFLAKFSPNGSLLFSTFFGGSSDDSSSQIAIDSMGNCYITGYTFSTDFPLKNAIQNSNNGNEDALIAKFTNNGSLIFSTYLGGNADDSGLGISVDSEGNSFIIGETDSINFPTSSNSSLQGKTDIFISEFSSHGLLLFSTYFGGLNDDVGYGIAVDSLRNMYITGSTFSVNFIGKNAYNSTYGGNGDCFVTKLDQDGNVTFSTFLGGSKQDICYAISVDANGNTYITGQTYSPNFPTKNNIIHSFDGKSDVFLAKLSSTGSLIYSILYGSSNNDAGYGLTVDSIGNCFITGISNASQIGIGGVGIPTKPFGDVFIAKFDPDGFFNNSLLIGGNFMDEGESIKLDTSGNLYVTGMTDSTDFPTINAFDPSYWMNNSFPGDIFLLKYSIGHNSSPNGQFQSNQTSFSSLRSETSEIPIDAQSIILNPVTTLDDWNRLLLAVILFFSSIGVILFDVYIYKKIKNKQK